MLYVCSDIHGQYDLYKQMINSISSDDTLYVLGDVIDRGPESIKILQDMMTRDNVFYCIGNHEAMMVAHYIGDYENDFWFHSGNGGRKTNDALLALSSIERKKLEDYIFNSTFLQIEVDIDDRKFLLSHSYFVKDCGTIKGWQAFYKRDEYGSNEVLDVVWNSPWRDYEYASESKYREDGRIHVIGHVPVQRVRYLTYTAEPEVSSRQEYADRLEPWRNESIINIDGGCTYLSNTQPPFKNVGIILLNLSESTQDKLVYKTFS